WMPGPSPISVRISCDARCSERDARSRPPSEAPIQRAHNLSTVMPGLGPGIDEFAEEKAHPATQDGSLFSCDLRDCACEPVDARPKAWHDEWGADGAKPLLRRLNLTPMGPSPGMTVERLRVLDRDFERRRGCASCSEDRVTAY